MQKSRIRKNQIANQRLIWFSDSFLLRVCPRVLKIVLRVANYLLDSIRKALQPFSHVGQLVFVVNETFQNPLSGSRKCVDGYRVAIFKPNCYGRVELASGGHFLVYDDYIGWLKRIRSHLRRFNLGALFSICQSVMPIKKLSIKSRKLQNPSRFSVRNFSNPRSCSSGYARPKSASQRDLSQRASNPSSSAEKFFSCFFARSTVLLGFGYGNYRAVLPAVVRSNRETGLSGASTRWRPERTQRDDEC